MRSGRKPDTPGQHAARGTDRPYKVEGHDVLEAPQGELAPPEGSLTDEAMQVWEDRAPQAEAMGTLKAADVEQFAVYCNLTAFIRQTHRKGEPAPASQYAEQRRQAELFGLAGEKSRMVSKGDSGGDSASPFARNGKRTRG